MPPVHVSMLYLIMLKQAKKKQILCLLPFCVQPNYCSAGDTSEGESFHGSVGSEHFAEKTVVKY